MKRTNGNKILGDALYLIIGTFVVIVFAIVAIEINPERRQVVENIRDYFLLAIILVGIAGSIVLIKKLWDISQDSYGHSP